MQAGVEIVDVSKAFSVRHNRSNSLKSKFVGAFYKRYRERVETFWALQNINLTIQPGESFGIIGRNGSGKSTLLRIIAGIYQPSSGRVFMPANARVGAMIELGVGFHPELTGRENIFLGASIHGLSRKEIAAIYPSIVKFSELDDFMDTALKNYSSGMHARLGFSLAINLNPSILIVDEVLAVGDEGFQEKCQDKMTGFKKQGKTIIFVSHDPEMVTAICDRVCVLDHGSTVYLGGSQEGVERYHAISRMPVSPNSPATVPLRI
jgi:homopolymeric O-antigen transport system ATP-binding protein